MCKHKGVKKYSFFKICSYADFIYILIMGNCYGKFQEDDEEEVVLPPPYEEHKIQHVRRSIPIHRYLKEEEKKHNLEIPNRSNPQSFNATKATKMVSDYNLSMLKFAKNHVLSNVKHISKLGGNGMVCVFRAEDASHLMYKKGAFLSLQHITFTDLKFNWLLESKKNVETFCDDLKKKKFSISNTLERMERGKPTLLIVILW